MDAKKVIIIVGLAYLLTQKNLAKTEPNFFGEDIPVISPIDPYIPSEEIDLNIPTYSMPFFHPIVDTMVMRMDGRPWGDGNYGASRNGNTRQHLGVDITVYKGQTIYSPIQGIITREAIPYASDPKYRGVYIEGTGQYTGYAVKMFYMTSNKIGQGIFAGDVIGEAQAINEKYSPQMTNHVHIEAYYNNQLIDPTPLLFQTV